VAPYALRYMSATLHRRVSAAAGTGVLAAQRPAHVNITRIERSTTGVQIDMEYPEQSQSEDQVIAEVKRLTKFLGDRYVVEKHFAGVAHRAQ
jgi:hypothetical protein